MLPPDVVGSLPTDSASTFEIVAMEEMVAPRTSVPVTQTSAPAAQTSAPVALDFAVYRSALCG